MRGYTSADEERFVREALTESRRPPFSRDRARILHSAGLRKLADKTQVVGPRSSDFVRNRLTHSLEVAQVGRDLASIVGCHPDVVEAACLAHDLGHPPFGHNGEIALNEAALGCGGFEGNAQTFRLLTRLEAKVADPLGRSVGLNLTRAVLDAASKYPWPLVIEPAASSASAAGRHLDGVPRATQKFGMYADDADVFDWMRASSRPRRPCIEAQVMDFADDVAYSVHDVEDGIVEGRIDATRLAASALRAQINATVHEWYDAAADDAALDDAWHRLTTHPAWPAGPYTGTRRELAGLKNLTSSLIGRLCRSVEDATLQTGDGGPVTRHQGDLVVPEETRAEILVLKGIAAHLVMSAADRVAEMGTERHLLLELVDTLSARGADALDPVFAVDYEAASSDSERTRVIVDQVASLTDVSAVSWHQRLLR